MLKDSLMAMKINGESQFGNQFIRQNLDLKELCSDKDFSIEIFETRGRLQIKIPVYEYSTHKSLRKTNTIALECQERLLEYQGPNLRLPKTKFLNSIDGMHNKGCSYALIAKYLNNSLIRNLYWKWRHAEDINKKSRNLKYKINISKSDFNWHYIFSCMNTLGISGEIQDNFLIESVDMFKRGENPIIKDNPITREHVIYTLKKWRKYKKKYI